MEEINTENNKVVLKTVQVDEDMFNIIQVTKETLGVSESEAVTKLAEIGIVNVLNYPLGNTLLDGIMEKNNFPELIKKIKAIWGL